MLVTSLEQEKRELEAMVERLARSPRLSELLRYIGERHLQGQDALIREYDIATQVFGRPPDFDQSTDAIARVEIHRLRKKLTVHYQTEGRGSSVHISIPPGSYRLEFSYHSPTQPTVPLDSQTLPEISAPESPKTHRKGLWVVVGTLGLLLIIGIVWIFERKSPPTAQFAKSGVRSAALTDALSVGLPADGKPIRILAGYEGQPHIDPSGNTWMADRLFDRGGGWHGTQAFTARTNDEFLFRTYRTGEFGYNIPLSPGFHELHLFFDETEYGPGLKGGEGSRSFAISLNSQSLFQSFDIVSDAMGPNIADERIIRDVVPATDGKLHLDFEGISGKPFLNGLEILPGLPHKQLPIRLTTQPMPFLDREGNVWSPDNYFMGGQSSLQKPPVSGNDDPGLFAMERWGHFSYALPVDMRGTYSVTLYFAEFYFGPDGQGKGGAGSRVFNVTCNGISLLRDFDIFKEVGTLRADIKTFHHLKPSAQGKLNFTFEPVSNYASLSAIKLEDEGR